MTENIEPASPAPPAFTPEEEFTAYRQMLLIRRFEEKAGQMYGMGLIAGFCHLYIGQEAVVVGAKMAAREDDQIVTSYRDHGHMLACGMDPKGVLAELTGRRSGFSKGKGGSMHMFSREKNFFGGHGIVGAPAPIGAGLAFANAYRRDDRVSLTFFGDGAANQGQVYETFNMAELWRLPVVFIVENNHYAMGMSVERSSAQRDFAKRGAAFNIPGAQVDGMDVRAMRAAASASDRLVPQGQWAIRPRGADLSLSRPFDVRSREISAQGRSGADARGARPHRAGALAPAGAGDKRGRIEEDRRANAQARRGSRRFRQRGPGAGAQRIVDGCACIERRRGGGRCEDVKPWG